MVRRHGEFAGLNVVQVFTLLVAVQHYAAQQLNEFHSAEATKNEEIEHAVGVGGIPEQRKRPAIILAIADEHHRAKHGRLAADLHSESRRSLHQHIHRAHDVAQRTKFFLRLPSGFLHDLGVEPNAGELGEILVVCHPEIHLTALAAGDLPPAAFDVAPRQRQFHGKHVHRSQRQNAERRVLFAGPAAGVGPADALQHLVHGAVAPGGYDQFMIFRQRFSDRGGIGRAFGQVQLRCRGESAQGMLEGGSLRAAGGGVENDRYGHDWKGVS